ncbi:hypothetical protein BVAVS116_E0023 (plasmid) [Borreliella valaisiana VS116]|uniref:Uncharacterized protein n=1 Tax=Borreliella valaisiana VS116 TaxID=445987 RepID=C0R8Q4_BORVA|nr:hypothetical protein BVAVS116_E0023 [Borreliella valaisiana VS116]
MFFKAKDIKNKKFVVCMGIYREHILVTFCNSFCATYVGVKEYNLVKIIGNL